MAELTEDRNLPRVLGDIQGYPILAASSLFEGSVVGLTMGYSRSYVDGDTFVGFCEQRVDNSEGLNGDLDVRVLTRGTIVLDVGGVTLTDIGRPVFTNDGVTFTIAEALGTKIGSVARYLSPGVCEVRFDAVNSAEVETVVTFPIDLPSISAGSVVTDYIIDFNCRVKSIFFVVNSPAIPAAKAADLYLETNILDGNVDGGLMALTSANCDTMGNIISGTPVTCCSGIIKGETIDIIAANIVAFTNGSGSITLTLGR